MLRKVQYDKTSQYDKDFVSMTKILRYFTLLRKVQYDKGLGLIIRYDEKFKGLVYSSDKQAQPKFKHTPYQSTPKIQNPKFKVRIQALL